LHFRKFEPPAEECIVLEGEFLRQACVKRPGLSWEDAVNLTQRWMDLFALPQVEGHSRLAQSLADLISWNEESLIEDTIQLLKGVKRPIVVGPFYTINDEDIWLGNEVKIQPGCTIDASNAPVVLAEGVVVGANSVIQGPCYI